MNYLVYLTYPILFVLLFWGRRGYKKGEFNKEWLSISQVKAIQGFTAICIMLHHIGQKTSASWLPKQNIIPGLEPFVPIGYILVCIFLFCSGYGLYKSYKTKENYLAGFVKRRILPVVLAGYLVSFLFFAARLLAGQKMSPVKMLCYLSGIRICNVNGWFVYALPLFYGFFYLFFRFCKKERTALLLTSLGVLGYVWLGTSLKHNDWVIGGEWWYNSAHAFLIGIFFAKFEKPVTEWVKKHYVLCLVVVLLCFLPLAWLEQYTQNTISYYAEYSHVKHLALTRWACLIPQMLLSTNSLFFVGLVSLKMRIGNRVLQFMGSITLEFYLIHGFFVELFNRKFLEIRAIWFPKNPALYIVVVLILSLPLAVLLHKAIQLIFKTEKKRVEP